MSERGAEGVKHAPDAPGNTINASPAGMTLSIPNAAQGAIMPETVQEDSTQDGGTREEFKTEEPDNDDKDVNVERTARFVVPATGSSSQKQFRQQFDQLMKRLEDRFQNERLELEEKHSKELEEAMGYFSLTSEEREAKQQELQVSLLEDIGNMAQQLTDLTGVLEPNEEMENLTLPSDPQVLEQYANRMQGLEEQFQQEKYELERKHASEMEEALGTLRLSREQRDAKQLELQDQLSAEIGDMAKQLEELNKAKQDYESKMAMLKQQLAEKPRGVHSDPHLNDYSRRLEQVERERDAAKDELRRLKLALQVTHGDKDALGESDLGARYASSRNDPSQRKRLFDEYLLSPEERENVSSLRGRIEQVERELQEAAREPGGGERMRNLRERMEYIEKDLLSAEESTKEQYALDNIRARMEKVERLLAEGERAAQDWEALEELKEKIGRVDTDLQAVEEAKKEYEALQTLRAKMQEVEQELKAAEQLASNRENVERLRSRLGQVERELGVTEPSEDDRGSIDKLLSRLNKAESSLEAARRSTPILGAPSRGRPTTGTFDAPEQVQRDDEVENILARLAQAERKLKAAKESAGLQRPDKAYTSPRDFSTVRAEQLDESQSKLHARLQNHFDESKPKNRNEERSEWWDLPHKARAKQPRERNLSFEEPRTLGGYSRDRYYVQDIHLERSSNRDPKSYLHRPRQRLAHERLGASGAHSEDDDANKKLSSDQRRSTSPTARPLRRIRGGLGEDQRLKASNSMPYTSLRAAGDRYVSDLQELRRQRDLLSPRLSKKGFEEAEEKKEDVQDLSQPKFSFKEAIRNEERQRLRNRLYPQSASKSTREGDGPAETGDPPMAAGFAAKHSEESKGDPPSETPSVKSHEDAPGEKNASAGASTSIKSKKERTADRYSLDPPDSESKERGSETPTDEVSLAFKHPDTFDEEQGNESFETQVSASIHAGTFKQETRAPSLGTGHEIVQPSEASPENTTIAQVAQLNEQSLSIQQQRTRPDGKEITQEVAQLNEQSLSIQQQRTRPDGKEITQERREKDRLIRWVVLILLLVAIVLAVVIILVVALTRNSNNSNSSRIGPFASPAPSPGVPITTSSPSTAPPSTVSPSSASGPPSATNRPTAQQPTSVGSGPPSAPNRPTAQQPTSAPIPSAALTGCPSLADVTPLLSDGVTREFSTVNSMYDASSLGACGAINTVRDDGVWFAVVGTGETLKIYTCTLFNPNFDTQILVYTQVQPTSGCEGGLSCVVANDDFCGLQSSVSWLAERGRLYLVYINGRTNNSATGNPAEGTFSLTVSTETDGSCQAATGPLEIQPNSGLPVVIAGTLMGGTFGNFPCSAELNTRTGEAWYKVTGNGRYIVASTCQTISEFPARLAVYTGTCDNLQCITADDQDCGNGNSISWLSAQGQQYYLLVYSPTYAPNSNFGLTVRELTST